MKFILVGYSQPQSAQACPVITHEVDVRVTGNDLCRVAFACVDGR
jgi:hypothetical protein